VDGRGGCSGFFSERNVVVNYEIVGGGQRKVRFRFESLNSIKFEMREGGGGNKVRPTDDQGETSWHPADEASSRY
jgi:hypothetical protein